MNTTHREAHPFLFGAQYYRAPTPAAECWEADMDQAVALGMTDLKFWVQWRVNQPGRGEYQFSDIDRLMDLAHARRLRVTLNVIYDCMPAWVLREHPDCLMVRQTGQRVPVTPDACRQTGGSPGPCLNHPAVRAIREEFTRAVVERYRAHPAMGMWDLWNEPEQCAHHRAPVAENLVCYCSVCRQLFARWLETKYGSLDGLNRVWGRYYRSWEELEIPITGACLLDMVDWRLFMLDTLNREAQWRLQVTRGLDPKHAAYLHPVPFLAHDTWAFNQVTCSDDFALAEHCDVLGGTLNGYPIQSVKLVSAAAGRVAYNVESHLRWGSTGDHPRPLTPQRLRSEFLAQIGLGIRGFLFWQFHAEVLGSESPAWGLLDCAGRPTSSAQAVAQFRKAIAPHLPDLVASPPPEARIGVLLTAANEIFQWSMGRATSYKNGLEGWSRLLYWNSMPFRYVPAATDALLAGLSVLIAPDAYLLSQAEADALARWVEAGGMLISEAHLGAYSATRGRHEGDVPGSGLAARWGIREIETMACFHTGSAARDFLVESPALAQVATGKDGGGYIPFRFSDGKTALGWQRTAGLEVDANAIRACFPDGVTALCRKAVGRGTLVYAGTSLGPAIEVAGNASAAWCLSQIRERVRPTADIDVRTGRACLCRLQPATRAPLDIVMVDGDEPFELSWASNEPLRGVFQDTRPDHLSGRATLRGKGPFAELFVVR